MSSIEVSGHLMVISVVYREKVSERPYPDVQDFGVHVVFVLKVAVYESEKSHFPADLPRGSIVSLRLQELIVNNGLTSTYSNFNMCLAAGLREVPRFGLG
jgi:hypothetical protein